MSFQRIIGLVALIVGLVLIGSSMYIKSAVLEGNRQIAAGQQKVDMADKIFSLSPTTQQFGSQATQSGKAKIAKGKEDIAFYTSLANKLQIGGIILIVAGAGIFLFGKKKR